MYHTISYLRSIAPFDFSHLSKYYSVHFVKPVKHNHEALHITQADIAALILILYIVNEIQYKQFYLVLNKHNAS